MLTPELAEEILSVASQGRLFDARIAIRCGLTPETLRLWLQKGFKEHSQEPYRSFADRYARIQVDCEDEAVKVIRDAATDRVLDPEMTKGDWKAAAWYLERRYPRRWGLERTTFGGAEAIDVHELLLDGERKKEGISELFQNPPPELEEAMKDNAQSIRAFLDALPAEPPEPALPALPALPASVPLPESQGGQS